MSDAMSGDAMSDADDVLREFVDEAQRWKQHMGAQMPALLHFWRGGRAIAWVAAEPLDGSEMMTLSERISMQMGATRKPRSAMTSVVDVARRAAAVFGADRVLVASDAYMQAIAVSQEEAERRFREMQAGALQSRWQAGDRSQLRESLLIASCDRVGTQMAAFVQYDFDEKTETATFDEPHASAELIGFVPDELFRAMSLPDLQTYVELEGIELGTEDMPPEMSELVRDLIGVLSIGELGGVMSALIYESDEHAAKARAVADALIASGAPGTII